MVPQRPKPHVTLLQSCTNYMKKKFSARHFYNQKQLVFFLAAILIVNGALFIARAHYFRGFSNLDGTYPNPFYMLSRANGNQNHTSLPIWLFLPLMPWGTMFLHQGLIVLSYFTI
jgi:hypothetical protein